MVEGADLAEAVEMSRERAAERDDCEADVYSREDTAAFGPADTVVLLAETGSFVDAALVDTGIASDEVLEDDPFVSCGGDRGEDLDVGCETARPVTVRRLAIEGAVDGALLLTEEATLGAGDARPLVGARLATDEARPAADAGRAATAGILLRFDIDLRGKGVGLVSVA